MAEAEVVHDKPQSQTSLKELALLFLRLGATAFGGPAAHIAMMQDEVVKRRRWLSEEEFLDLLGATNLIPGPNSTEMAIHIGHKQRGFAGLVVAGACFILPAVVIVTGIAWTYTTFSKAAVAVGILDGVKPVVIAIILQALLGLRKSALKSSFLIAMFVSVCFGSLVGLDEIFLLLVSGTSAAIWYWWSHRKSTSSRPVVIMVLTTLLFAGLYWSIVHAGVQSSSSISFSLQKLFWYFAKVGSVLYGSGYVLLAFLRSDLVHNWHWLTSQQLLDATAVGQVTPGPVFTTATFIGYMLGGLPGALVATTGIFLPAFVFVGLSGPLVARLRKSPISGAFLNGVNAGSLALMAVVIWQLAVVALSSSLSWVLFVVSGVLLWRYHVNSSWLVLGAALVGSLIRS